MDRDLPINARVTIPRSELDWRFSRSSGPGGQGVNTTDSRAELIFDLTGSPSIPPDLRSRASERLRSDLVDGRIHIAASEHRSQLRNRRAAEDRLVMLLREAFAPPPPPRRKTRPSKAAVDRRISAKKRRGATKRLRRSTGD